MNKIIAYIPTINKRHTDWFRKVKPYAIYVISTDVAKSFLPRLERNLSAVELDDTLVMLRSLNVASFILPFEPDFGYPRTVDLAGYHWWLPDEDISHLVYEKHLKPFDLTVSFENIWARWDMHAVQSSQPIVPSDYVTKRVFDRYFMGIAYRLSKKSPDWWRQVGAVLKPVSLSQTVLGAYNTHLPDEYEVYIFGDPRLYANAGQKSKSCAMHAERAVIAESARLGISTAGASIYVTTFPCEDCAREIVIAGISKVFFSEGYSVLNALDVLRSNRVSVIKVAKDPESA